MTPSPDQNQLAQREPAPAPEFAVADLLPMATWKQETQSRAGHTPILTLNQRWAPPMDPLAQTSLLRV